MKKCTTRKLKIFGKHYATLAKILQNDGNHVWFGPLVGLLGFAVTGLWLLTEGSISSEDDAQ